METNLFPISDIFNTTIDRVDVNEQSWFELCEQIKTIFDSNAELIQMKVVQKNTILFSILSNNKYYKIHIIGNSIKIEDVNDAEKKRTSTKSTKKE